MKTTPETVARFCALLRVPEMANAQKRETRLQSRLIGLSHGEVCGRCGGSGHYSFNLMNGTICFGCGGSGYVAQRLTEKLFAECAQDVASGKLDAYLSELARKADLRRKTNGATDRVMAAWKGTGISSLYDWRKAAQRIEPDREIADRANGPCCAHYDKVSKLANELTMLGVRRVKTLTERQARDARIEALTAELVIATETALAEIPRFGVIAREIANRAALNPS